MVDGESCMVSSRTLFSAIPAKAGISGHMHRLFCSPEMPGQARHDVFILILPFSDLSHFNGFNRLHAVADTRPIIIVSTTPISIMPTCTTTTGMASVAKARASPRRVRAWGGTTRLSSGGTCTFFFSTVFAPLRAGFQLS